MLILNRGVGERIAIGPEITVEVVGFDACGRVRLGIVAPRPVLILREELQGSEAERELAARAFMASLPKPAVSDPEIPF